MNMNNKINIKSKNNMNIIDMQKIFNKYRKKFKKYAFLSFNKYLFIFIFLFNKIVDL